MGSSRSTTVVESGNNKQVGSQDGGVAFGSGSYANLANKEDSLGFGSWSSGNIGAKDNATVLASGASYSYSQTTALDKNTADILDKALSSVSETVKNSQEIFRDLSDDFFSLAGGQDIQPNNTAASFNLKSPVAIGLLVLGGILLLGRLKK